MCPVGDVHEMGAPTSTGLVPYELENKNLYFKEAQYLDGSNWSAANAVPSGEVRIETEFYFAAGTSKVMIVEYIDGEELLSTTAKYTMTNSDVVIYNADGTEFFHGTWMLVPGTSKTYELTRVGSPPSSVPDPGEVHPYEFLDANGAVVETHAVPSQTLFPVMSFRLEALAE